MAITVNFPGANESVVRVKYICLVPKISWAKLIWVLVESLCREFGFFYLRFKLGIFYLGCSI